MQQRIVYGESQSQLTNNYVKKVNPDEQQPIDNKHQRSNQETTSTNQVYLYRSKTLKEDPFVFYKPRFVLSTTHQKQKHSMKHESDRQDDEIKCTEPGCGKIFKKKEYLKKHLAIHLKAYGDIKSNIYNESGCDNQFVLLRTH